MRDLFRHSEDMLTATVFERLGYLPGPLMWELLCGTLQGLPLWRMVRVVDILFWPRWFFDGEDEDASSQGVEPDVVLILDLGDPVQRTWLMIEVKTKGPQKVSQWCDQLRAVRRKIKVDKQADKQSVNVIFAALGGVDAANVQAQWNSVPDDLREGVSFVHGGWSDLGRTLAKRKPAEPEHERALDDIAQALALYGYTTIILSDALTGLPRLQHPHTALDTLLEGWTT